MSRIGSKIVDILTGAALISLISLTSLSYYWKYKTYASKIAIENELVNCIEDLICQNIFEKTDKKEYKLLNRYNLTLYYDSKKSEVYSKKYKFTFNFGNDIECYVKSNKPLCKVTKSK